MSNVWAGSPPRRRAFFTSGDVNLKAQALGRILTCAWLRTNWSGAHSGKAQSGGAHRRSTAYDERPSSIQLPHHPTSHFPARDLVTISLQCSHCTHSRKQREAHFDKMCALKAVALEKPPRRSPPSAELDAASTSHFLTAWPRARDKGATNWFQQRFALLLPGLWW